MRLPPEERSHYVRFAASFAAVIVGGAVLHDLHLVFVEPRHFTQYHPPLLPLDHPALIALQYATVASLGPGLAFGFLAYFSARYGRAEKMPLRSALIPFALLVAGVECALLALGAHARSRFAMHGTTIFPAPWFPELSAGIVYTQTINIGAYLLAPVSGALYLLTVRIRRRRPPPRRCIRASVPTSARPDA